MMNINLGTTGWVGYVCLISMLLISGNLSAAQSAAPYTSAVRYDAIGRVTGTIQPDPDGAGPLRFLAVRNTYTHGLLMRVESGELATWHDENTQPANWSGFSITLTKAFAYDHYGRKTVEATLDGPGGSAVTLVQYSYDTKGRVECKTVRMNASSYSEFNFNALPAACSSIQHTTGADRVTRYTYSNDLDLVLTETRAHGTPLAQVYVTNTYYDYTRLLKTQKDANGNMTALYYDETERLRRREYPSPTSVGQANVNDYNSYTYDENSNLHVERKRNGATITYTYDNNNRLTRKNLSDNTHFGDVSYAYDLRGLTLHSRFGSHSGRGIINTFDGFGNLSTSTNTLGNVSRRLSYLYDRNGNRRQITHPDGTFFTYTFDGLNRVNGVGESASTNLLTVSYRDNGRRHSITRDNSATTVYTFDNALRLHTLQQNLANSASRLTNTFTYNAANQVTSLQVSNTTYRYQGNANREGTYLPDGLNRYATINGQPLTYDSNHNLIDDGVTAYEYDMENRLVSTMESTASSFKYDPLGRLHEVTIGNNKTQFLYDGDALVAEYDAAGVLLRRYVHGDRVDEPWVQYNGSAVGATQRRYLHADHQGSIIAHSNRVGNATNKLTYDSFGIPADDNIDRFGYTGQIWFKELGLYHYKARMYHPKLGRFLQTDPIGYADQMNLYAYVGNDPVNFSDPMGLAKCGNIEGEQCEQALNDADQAKADVDNVKSGIDGITNKMANGEGLTDSEQSFVDAIGEKFGDKFTSEKGLNRLSEGLGKISNKIGVRGEGMALMRGNNSGSNTVAYVNSMFHTGLFNGNKVYLNDLYFRSSHAIRTQAMAHEAAHLGGIMGDVYIRNGINPLFNSPKAWRNADTYACLAVPLRCGY